MAIVVLLTACGQDEASEEPFPRPSVSVEKEVPFIPEVGEQQRYQISSITSRSVTARPVMSNSSRPPSQLEFELNFEVLVSDGGQIELEGRIPYIVVRERLASLLFTIDTRNANTEMDDMHEGEFAVIHPGLKDPEHSLNQSWKLLKAITERPFRVRLDANGGFQQLQAYELDVEDLQGLNTLEPEKLAQLLCLAFPPRTPQLARSDTRWAAICADQPTVFSIDKISDQGITYGLQMSYPRDESSNQLTYRGVLNKWLETGKLQLTQTKSSKSYHKSVGDIIFTSRVDSEVHLMRLQ